MLALAVLVVAAATLATVAARASGRVWGLLPSPDGPAVVAVGDRGWLLWQHYETRERRAQQVQVVGVEPVTVLLVTGGIYGAPEGSFREMSTALIWTSQPTT